MDFSQQVIKNWQIGGACGSSQSGSSGCNSSSGGCPSDVCPDFIIKRHDTRPPFKVAIEDCDGSVDLTGLVIEASMWAKSKLKKAITVSDTYFEVGDNNGFEQMMVGDIIIMDRVRLPEHMLITGFDEIDQIVEVQRGYNGTQISPWKKGNAMQIVKMMNAPAESEMILIDSVGEDGTIKKDTLTTSLLIYNWQPTDVCLPGCYYLEFKVIKMLDATSTEVAATTNSTPITPADYGCTTGLGVDWMRRYPVNSDGYLIQVVNSITAE